MARRTDSDLPSQPGEDENQRENRKQRRIDAQMLAALYGANEDGLERFRRMRLGQDSEVTHEDMQRARELLEALVGALRDDQAIQWRAIERAWAELTPDTYTEQPPDSVTDAGQTDDGDRPTTPPAPPVAQPSWPGATAPISDSGETPTRQPLPGQSPPGRTTPGHTAPTGPAGVLGGHTPTHGVPAWGQTPAMPQAAITPQQQVQAQQQAQQAQQQAQAQAAAIAAHNQALWGQAYAPGSLPAGMARPAPPHPAHPVPPHAHAAPAVHAGHPGGIPQQAAPQAPMPGAAHAQPAHGHQHHHHAAVGTHATPAGQGPHVVAPLPRRGHMTTGAAPNQSPRGTQPLTPQPAQVGAYLQRQAETTPAVGPPPGAGSVGPAPPSSQTSEPREPTPPLFSTQKVDPTTAPAPVSRRTPPTGTAIDDELQPPSERTNPQRTLAPGRAFDPTATIALSPSKRTTQTTELSFGSASHAFALSIEEYAALCAQRDADPQNVQRIEKNYDVYDDRIRDAVDRSFELRFEEDSSLEEAFKRAYARCKVILAGPESDASTA
jgi:hypothetical protein